MSHTAENLLATPCTGTVKEYNPATGRGQIAPSDGASWLGFEERDVMNREELEIMVEAPVKFRMMISGSGAAEARNVSLLDPEEPCPCGSGSAWSICHGMKRDEALYMGRGY